MSECRVHSCVFQQRVVAQKSEPDPQRSCKCRKLVTQEKAKELVDCGEATFQVIARERKEQYKPCRVCGGGDEKSSCLECKKTGKVLDVQVNEVYGRDIVKNVFKTKTNRVSTPRVPTIEAKHILRAYVSTDTRDEVAKYAGELTFERLGDISPAQAQMAAERIEEYGRMTALSLMKFGARIQVRVTGKATDGQRTIYAGNPEPVGGRENDWGRAI